MKIKTILFFTALFFVTAIISKNSFAQRNYMLYNMDYTAQSHYLNPAFVPNGKVYISLPLGMHSFGVSHTGFNVSNAFKKRPQDDSLVVDIPNIIRRSGKNNFVSAESYNELLAFGFKVKDNYFSVAVTNRLFASASYTRDLLKFAYEGNGESYLGKRINLNNTSINLNSYFEYALGYNRKVNDKLQVGGRLKFLSGVANVKTKKSKLGITTDSDEFDITIDGQYEVRSSGIRHYYDTLEDNKDFPIANLFNFKNFGIAVDLGASYKLTDKITVSASLLDLGFISWKYDNATFRSEDVKYTFRGIDLEKYFNDTTASNMYESIKENVSDTLNKIFTINENDRKYTTGLNTRFYLSGKYTFNQYYSVSATLFNEFINSKYRAALILSGTMRVKNWWGITVSYSNYGRSYGNIGLGLMLRGGPIQFFAATDNIIGAFAPYHTKNIHVSAGLNLLIGKPKKEEVKSARFE